MRKLASKWCAAFGVPIDYTNEDRSVARACQRLPRLGLEDVVGVVERPHRACRPHFSGSRVSKYHGMAALFLLANIGVPTSNANTIDDKLPTASAPDPHSRATTRKAAIALAADAAPSLASHIK